MQAVHLVIRSAQTGLSNSRCVRQSLGLWQQGWLALALHLKAIGTFKLNMQSYLGEALNGRLLDY